MIRTYNNIGLKPFNTLRLDSLCDCLVEFDAVEDAPSAVSLAENQAIDGKIAIIGGGSNIVFSEEYHGVLLHPAVQGWDVEMLGNGRAKVTVGAGVELDRLVSHLCAVGYWGLENLSGIPGSVGGAAVQNAGAYGVEFGEVVKSIKVWDIAGKKFLDISREELHYGYRHSLLKEPEYAGRYIVLEVCIEVSSDYSPRLTYGPLKALSSKENLTPAEVRTAILEIRDSKLPKVEEVGSAGSYFKNPVIDSQEWKVFCKRLESENIDVESVPRFVLENDNVKIPAAWLIEQCGWKGRTLGNAGVWHKQPLILVNATGNASSTEILNLESAIVESVNSKFGIELKPEVVYL
ncbi:MAG: UDP-N-acetylmuramate dehydrogenase [Paramuribaculum sp.]|nr:UDP-N-acetylmuramate dehydrogenase [Paramuribaculum sp.]